MHHTKLIGRHLLACAIALAWIAPVITAIPSREDDPVAEPFEREWDRGPVRLALRISNTAPLVSDEISVELQVIASDSVEVKLPSVQGISKDFQISGIRETGPTEQPDGAFRSELRFRLEVLRGGSFEWPALSIRYRMSGDSEWNTAETEPVSLKFQSLLEDSDSLELRENPGPLGWPMSWWFWILTAVLVLAATVLGLVTIALWRRRTAPLKQVVRQPPYRVALDAIDRIESARYLERGEVDRFYTELSAVIRYYIEGQFGLRAPERTTEEFLQELTSQPILLRSHRDALASFLEQCDLVKFAKVRPDQQEGKRVLNAARSFVEATRDDSLVATSTAGTA